MIKDLEKKINYKFKNQGLLKQALTHSSRSAKLSENYERLEFLGDRVLGFSIAYILFKMFPDEPEGSLSQRQVALVNKDAVAEVALKLNLDKYMDVDNDDIRKNENVLCDVCEAIIGAIFLDGTGSAAFTFIEENWKELLEKDHTPPKDAKTTLQEIAHTKNLSAPVYSVVSREGSEHEPVFNVSVKVGNLEPQVGRGRSKKIAEQEAANKMVRMLTAED